MASQHPPELDSSAMDATVTPSPRPDRSHDDHPRVRFMCSFGGRILPRPHDNQLRYVGGDTRIVAVHRNTSYAALLARLSKISGASCLMVKYQLPSEDLDALISVTTDEDVENMMEEYDRLSNNQSARSARLRLFLFPSGSDSRSSSIGSLLDGSAKREHWFLDALNGGSASGLERGRSEASSIVSEVPDYLFGFDNSEDTKPKVRPILSETVSVSDPNSPAPGGSSPFGSIPDLPPVKTKPEASNLVMVTEQSQNNGLIEAIEQPISQQAMYPTTPTWAYTQETHFPGPTVQPVPVYYVPGPVQPTPIRAPYGHQFPVPPGQIPVGFRPPFQHLYGGAPMKPMDPYDMGMRVIPDGANQPVYYAVRNTGMVPAYSGMVMPVPEELQGTGGDTKADRVS